MTAITNPAPKTIDDWANEINKHATTTLEGLLCTAEACWRAQRAVKKEDRNELKKKLKLDPSKFSQYVKIGEQAERWSDPEVRKLLPAGFTVLYPLAKLNNAQWQKALRENLINPQLKREDIKRWLNPDLTKPGKTKRRTITLPEGLDSDKVDEIDAQLEALATRFGLQVSPQKSKAAETADRRSVSPKKTEFAAQIAATPI